MKRTLITFHIGFFHLFLSWGVIAHAQNYPIVGTNQTTCFNNLTTMSPPDEGEDYCGQHAFYPGNVTSYTDNSGGTIPDNATGLMWSRDDNGEAVTWKDALSYAKSAEYANYSDWKLLKLKSCNHFIKF